MICYKTKLRLKKNTVPADIWTVFVMWYSKSQTVSSELKEWLSAYSLSDGTFEKNFDKKSASNAEKNNLKLFFVEQENLLAICVTEYGEENVYRFSIVFNVVKKYKTVSFVLEDFSLQGCYKQHFMPANFIHYLKPYLQDGLYSEIPLIPDEDFFNIINGKKITNLPVVYFSRKTRSRKDVWNPCADKAAQKLFGLAEVYKEEGSGFSEVLRKKTSGKNPFNAAVGIYWKNHKQILLNPTLREIVYCVCRFLSMSFMPEELTWNYAGALYYKKCIKKFFKQQEENEKLLEIEKQKTDEFKQLSENLSKDLDSCTLELQHQRDENEQTKRILKKTEDDFEKYIEEFDPEIEKLRAENEKLRNELEGYKRRFSKSGSKDFSIEFNLNEKNLFPCEIDDFVKGVLYKCMLEKSKGVKRTKDVASDFVNSNPTFEFAKSQAFAKYARIEKQVKSGETEIEGFSFETDNGHKKYSFCNDPRYRITKANTVSDERANENLASDVRKFFLKP